MLSSFTVSVEHSIHAFFHPKDLLHTSKKGTHKGFWTSLLFERTARKFHSYLMSHWHVDSGHSAPTRSTPCLPYWRIQARIHTLFAGYMTKFHPSSKNLAVLDLDAPGCLTETAFCFLKSFTSPKNSSMISSTSISVPKSEFFVLVLFFYSIMGFSFVSLVLNIIRSKLKWPLHDFGALLALNNTGLRQVRSLEQLWCMIRAFN